MDNPSTSREGEEVMDYAPLEPLSQVAASAFHPYQHAEEQHYEYEYDADMDGNIAGVDVRQQLPPASSVLPTGGFDQTLDRFMRGEIDYNRYMEIIGAPGLQEEMRDYNAEGNNSMDSDEEVEGVVEEEEVYEETEQVRSVKLTNRGDMDLPHNVRTLMDEVVSGELDAARTLAPTETYRSSVPRKLSKTLNDLLGHANLLYARGDVKQALTTLLEVIRQEPRHWEAYKQISDIHIELSDEHKHLQYGLLAAHLDQHTGHETWSHWGDLSSKLNMCEEAACCYGRAVKLDPQNWRYYEKRIEVLERIGLRPLAMRTRLQAAQLINTKEANATFDWFHQLIKSVVQYYSLINDEDRSIQALEAFVLRSKEFGNNPDSQHETLIGMWIAKNKFVEAGKSIFALCDGINVTCKNGLNAGQPAFKVELINGTFSVDPFPPEIGIEYDYEITDALSTAMLCRLVVVLVALDRRELALPLKDELLNRDLSNCTLEGAVLDIARAYFTANAYKSTKVFLEKLQEWSNYRDNDEQWFIYGNSLASLKDLVGAMAAYERTLDLNPMHVDARINLSSLQQKAGLAERALDTLRGYDLDTCTHLPEERLLMRQADVLFDAGETDQFVRTVRMLLTPHFYQVHKFLDSDKKKRPPRTPSGTGIQLSNTLRVAAHNAIQGTPWEKFVKRLGSNAMQTGRNTDEIDVGVLHDYCLKLIECLMNLSRYQDMLVVCCYAFLLPRVTKSDKSLTFQNLLYFCAIKANSWTLAFEHVRWYHNFVSTAHATVLPNNRDILYKRVFNAMNYVFVHSQNVSYHRYVMRQLVKAPGNNALQAISGNNSLITGTYRHALGEYLRVWNQNKKNPLICLLLALTFTHMSCKKDLSSRHMIALRGIAFMKKYERWRTCRQEVYYNIGRMFHQMSITPLAIHFYEKVLAEPAPLVYIVDEEGNETTVDSERYDMSRFAAHNLALLYKTSGNEYLAKRIYEQYLMFVLSLLQDTVTVKPHELGLDVRTVVKRRLNKRLTNKVVPGLGLVICVYDVVEMGDSYIMPGEGRALTKVKFHVVVFRPFIGEVVESRVMSSTKNGLVLSTDFFEDIFIPAANLPEPSVFEDSEQVWYWDYTIDESEEKAKLYMDPGKTVRFRVKETIFKDVKPGTSTDPPSTEKSMEIIGTLADHGLGCLGWWSSDGAEDDDMEEE